MVYRNLRKTNTSPSAIGLGTMRLPLLLEGQSNYGDVDIKASIELIELSIDVGINYIDTAWSYHNGKSELIVGDILKNHKRKDLYIATKAPVWEIESIDDFNRILETQLNRLNTDYIDFYMLHALGKERWEKVLSKGLTQALYDAKQAGIVRNIGFSFHDNYDVFKQIINSFDKWDFCQIQYNYRDTEKQSGTKGLIYASNKGLDVIIMEPLRGGELVNPPKQVNAVLPKYKTPIEWGFAFLWDKPEVGIILSGMNSIPQVYENTEYANKSYVGMLTEEERNLFPIAKRVFDTTPAVPCTKCNYCSIICPNSLLIPDLFDAYNRIYNENYTSAKTQYVNLQVKADSCTSCKLCEKYCPQKITISKIMSEIVKAFALPIPETDWEALKIKWPARYQAALEKNRNPDNFLPQSKKL